MTKELFLPAEWAVTNDYNSHRPLLYKAIDATKGKVIELGSGYGSTELLADYCKAHNRTFYSLETDPKWIKFPATQLITNYYKADKFLPCAVLFIDCAPGELRKELIEYYKDLDVWMMVIHDTEPGAEYVYHMADILSQFKYRADCIYPGHPSTTAVSNEFNFRGWKGDYGDFKIEVK